MCSKSDVAEWLRRQPAIKTSESESQTVDVFTCESSNLSVTELSFEGEVGNFVSCKFVRHIVLFFEPGLSFERQNTG